MPAPEQRNLHMIHVPLIRWGEPYQSMDVDKVVHFNTGEPIAEVSQALPGMVRRDMRKTKAALATFCCVKFPAAT